ncbi:MAG: biopolymer transporter ExbD [Gammaproteobacteria bacterium]|nr:biopolymer transporter ExbD [Gammaproteobacteria bacterium]
MGMSAGGNPDEPMMEINTTPLIDVMLVLLIMFIITIPVMTHAVKLDMPRPSEDQIEPPVPPEIIELEIDYDGTILWNGTEVKSFATLERYFRQESTKPVQPELHILANKRTRYDSVAKALALAQRQGLVKIGFKGMEQYAQ